MLNVRKADIDETRWAEVPEPWRVPRRNLPSNESGSDDDTVLTVKEERIRADKERTQTGEVAVGTRVVQQQADMDVPGDARGGPGVPATSRSAGRRERDLQRGRGDHPGTGDCRAGHRHQGAEGRRGGRGLQAARDRDAARVRRRSAGEEVIVDETGDVGRARTTPRCGARPMPATVEGLHPRRGRRRRRPRGPSGWSRRRCRRWSRHRCRCGRAPRVP